MGTSIFEGIHDLRLIKINVIKLKDAAFVVLIQLLLSHYRVAGGSTSAIV